MSRFSKVIVLLGLVLSAPCIAARAADDSPPKKLDPQAEKVFRAAADYLQGLKTFSAEMKSKLHIDAPIGGNDMATVFSIALEQPNRMAIQLKEGTMGANVVCDGKELSIYVPRVNKYSVEEAPKTLSELTHGPGLMAQMVHRVSFSGLFMLLEAPKEMLDDIEAAAYLGEEKLGEQAVHHLKISTKATDYDYWIDTGDKPLVRKIVPDMAKALERTGAQLPEGVKLDMVALCSNWQIDPQLPAEDFHFSPPKGAEKVDSLFGVRASAKRHPLLGKDAPMFELAALTGKPVKLTDYKEKDVIILDFWATWCGPCVQALPTIAEVAATYKPKGVVFYAVNLGEDAETVGAFLKEKKLDVPVLLDKEGTVGGLYGAEAIPQTVIIGKDGVVQVVHVGLSPNLKEKLTQELDDLLAGKKLAEEGQPPEDKDSPPAGDEKPGAK